MGIYVDTIYIYIYVYLYIYIYVCVCVCIKIYRYIDKDKCVCVYWVNTQLTRCCTPPQVGSEEGFAHGTPVLCARVNLMEV